MTYSQCMLVKDVNFEYINIRKIGIKSNIKAIHVGVNFDKEMKLLTHDVNNMGNWSQNTQKNS